MQSGADKWQLSGFLGVDIETLERSGECHPDFQKDGAENYQAPRPLNVRATAISFRSVRGL